MKRGALKESANTLDAAVDEDQGSDSAKGEVEAATDKKNAVV